MKKNMMMRVAFVLLIAVLLTTSVIGGTFAKYITSGHEGSDSAQVAKFGVSVQVNNDSDLFKTEYETDDNEYSGTLSVKSISDTGIVAPGTKGSMSVKVSGKPEVATKMTCNVSGAPIQIASYASLPAGYYSEEELSHSVDNPYEPIKFYFGTAPIASNTKYELTMVQLTNKIKETFSGEFEPNYNYDNGIGTYYIGWCWPFENPDVENADFFDTYLGYEAARGIIQDVNLAFDITIEQID